MKRMIKTELWKSLHNVYFYLALGIGALIVLAGAIQNYQTVMRLTNLTLDGLEAGLDISGGTMGMSLFVWALPYNRISYASRLYSTIWPILAAMPYGWSYCAERRSGLYNQIVVRSNPGTYFVSKYIAVFVSGGLVVAFPMFADLLTNALFCPDDVLDVMIRQMAILNGWFLSELYYTYPWVHALIWCFVVFFLGGAAAGLCFLVGTRLRLQVLVVLTPFALLMLWDVIYNNVIYAYFWEVLPSEALSPLRMVCASGPKHSELLIISVIWGLTVLGAGIGYWQVKRHELV